MIRTSVPASNVWRMPLGIDPLAVTFQGNRWIRQHLIITPRNRFSFASERSRNGEYDPQDSIYQASR